ncbi:hypothetical protein CRUP_005707 [Coryphaenoides rupestris]|nr:hypothetical protein CRUP_005707 [Coryphaenoides rupestris]
MRVPGRQALDAVMLLLLLLLVDGVVGEVAAAAEAHAGCPCQEAHDNKMEEEEEEEEEEYADQAGITGQQQDPEAGVQAQTTAAFTLLQVEMDSRGWRMSDVVLVHLVCVQAPLAPGLLLQMDCLLHHCDRQPLEDGSVTRREALHVQSLSHWAPANIGPYSQALRHAPPPPPPPASSSLLLLLLIFHATMA